MAPVARNSKPNSSIVFSTWTSRLVRWCLPGSTPYSATSVMWDSHVTGNQFASSVDLSAHAAPLHVSPWATWGFSLT
jgi:hypothetical protein